MDDINYNKYTYIYICLWNFKPSVVYVFHYNFRTYYITFFKSLIDIRNSNEMYTLDNRVYCLLLPSGPETMNRMVDLKKKKTRKWLEKYL